MKVHVPPALHMTPPALMLLLPPPEPPIILRNSATYVYTHMLLARLRYATFPYIHDNKACPALPPLLLSKQKKKAYTLPPLLHEPKKRYAS